MNIRRIFSTITKKYEPFDYWTERGKVYQKEFKKDNLFEQQETAIVEYLKKIGFETVLEVGCGFGRITKLILENFSIKKYIALDLSADQIKNAQDMCKGFENVKFVQSMIQDYDTKEKI